MASHAKLPTSCSGRSNCVSVLTSRKSNKQKQQAKKKKKEKVMLILDAMREISHAWWDVVLH